MSKRNTRAVVISHDRDSTKRLFKRVKYYIKNLRGPKPITTTDSADELFFEKTNSTFYIGTAGAKKFGRGDTITDLHCSEVAFWEGAKELFSGLSDSVPVTGTIILESTGNGHNWYCNRVMRALEKKTQYYVAFFNWHEFPEYDLAVTAEEIKEIEETLDPEYEEDVLYGEGILTAGQIKFRREKLEDKDWDLGLFKQEYPMTVDECFQATSTSIFSKVDFRDKKEWVKVEKTGTFSFYKHSRHPRPEYHYIIGADVGGGVGKDNSVIEVGCIETYEQVGEWVSNRIDPATFAHKIDALGRLFNMAFLDVERNNHGILTLYKLMKLYPPHLMAKDPKVNPNNPLMSQGTNTSVKTKPLFIGHLRTGLMEGFKIYSTLARDELSTFIEHPNGSMSAEEGSMDDSVIGLAMMLWGYNKALMLMSTTTVDDKVKVDPFSLGAIIMELHGKSEGFPIKQQAVIIEEATE